MSLIKKYIVFPTLLFAALFFVQCGGETPGAGNEPVAGKAVFIPAEIAPLSWDAKQLELKISWSKTAWKLAKLPGDVIESVSVEMGGNADKEGDTVVEVVLYPNTSASERSQELMLTNFSTKETVRLKITQQTTSVSSKITLNPDVAYQKVTGFGGMLNPTWTGNNLRDAEVQKLYGDLGYNIIRMMLYPNKSEWG